MSISVEKAQAIIRDVLYAFRNLHLDEDVINEKVNIPDIIDSCLSNYPDSNRVINLVTENTDNVSILANSSLLNIVIVNLIKNSLHAIEQSRKGEIFIFTDIVSDDEQVLLHFKDTASGINDDIIDKIFDPFFTTKKETAASIGIGLFFCRICLERMGAEIRCESVLGEYTDFIMTFKLS